MRTRRKKHLDERLEACSEIITKFEIDERDFSKAAENKKLMDLSALFGRDAPVVLEIGCGKGGFACEYARRNPGVNVLALEKASNVIVTAAENALSMGIKNLHFLHGNAEYLEKFIPEGSVKVIFLNFSCPYPKKAYENHRLTGQRFLKIYSHIMAPDGEIQQKTDNMHFFEYSIEQLSSFGFALKDVSLDLHASGFEGNIETEYEKRFSSQGMPIYRLVACRSTKAKGTDVINY